MKKLIAIALTTLAITQTAQAHRAWILPDATVLSSEAPWVTFDAAISNDIFYTDYHPMGTDNITATAPSGKTIQLQNTHTGKFRSSFDLELTEEGTYKIASFGKGLFASWQENGERKRARGSKEEIDQKIPDHATDVQYTESARRTETWVTWRAPTNTVNKPTSQGLELKPITHPNDLYAGETAQFQLLIDGEPAKGAEVEVVPAGTRYRDQQNEMTLNADDKGMISIQWPQAGRYWLGADYEDDQSQVEGAKRRASYMATFEVLPL